MTPEPRPMSTRQFLALLTELRKHPSGQVDCSRILYGGQTCDPLLPLIELWLKSRAVA